ncbi:dihydrolipoyl dehydrogenase family protein [Streptomyces sp. O3]
MSASAYDLVVIGGGSAGLTAARTAGRLGARTLLVERARLGGDCLWTGCVPSKALLHTASEVSAARRAGAYGLTAPSGPAGLAAAMAHVRRAIAAVEPHDSAASLRPLGVEVASGAAEFTGPRTLSVAGGTPFAGTESGGTAPGGTESGGTAPDDTEPGGAAREVSFRYALIATGSAPTLAPIAGLAEANPLTSDTVWALTALPGRLVVLGGGPVGCELGQAFARLGSRVTLVEALNRPLPREEPRASATVRAALEADGVRVLTGYRAEQVADGALHGPGGPVPYDRLLAVTGRRANTAGLGLERAGVRLDARGRLRTDGRLRTTNPRIYAAGDVTGRSALTHLGGVQGAAAAVDALLGVRRRIDYAAVPSVTYTDPEVARVGLTADEARTRYGHGVRVRTLDHDRVDRAVADGRADGFSSLVLAPRGKIVGATVVAPRAGETIAHLAAAVRLGWTAAQYARTVHPYPTYADGPWHAALQDVYARVDGARRATDALLGLRRRIRR